jgi:hypothetical protein
MSITREAERPSSGEALRAWADPGWADRRDQALGVVGLALGLGAGCGAVINCLGWPVGVLVAGGLYLAWLWLMLAALGGGGR